MKYRFSEGKVSLGGPPVDALDSRHSDKKDMIYVGERNYDDPLLDPLHGVEEPKIENSWVARKASLYIRRIIHSLNRQIVKEGGVKLRYSDLKIKAMKRPQFSIDEDGRVGLVLGYYDTRTKEIYLNPYIDEDTLKKVTTHEIVHYAQDKLGIIGSYIEKYGEKSRGMIERHADIATREIMPDLFYLDRIQPVEQPRSWLPRA